MILSTSIRHHPGSGSRQRHRCNRYPCARFVSEQHHLRRREYDPDLHLKRHILLTCYEKITIRLSCPPLQVLTLDSMFLHLQATSTSCAAPGAPAIARSGSTWRGCGRREERKWAGTRVTPRCKSGGLNDGNGGQLLGLTTLAWLLSLRTGMHTLSMCTQLVKLPLHTSR